MSKTRRLDAVSDVSVRLCIYWKGPCITIVWSVIVHENENGYIKFKYLLWECSWKRKVHMHVYNYALFVNAFKYDFNSWECIFFYSSLSSSSSFGFVCSALSSVCYGLLLGTFQGYIIIFRFDFFGDKILEKKLSTQNKWHETIVRIDPSIRTSIDTLGVWKQKVNPKRWCLLIAFILNIHFVSVNRSTYNSTDQCEKWWSCCRWWWWRMCVRVRFIEW